MKSLLSIPRILVALFLSNATVHPSLAITYTNIDFPAGMNTQATDIESNNIVGFYSDGATYHGFLYNGTNYTSLDAPLATGGTFPRGISRGRIIGSYSDSVGNHGFLYNGSDYISFDHPLAATNRTAAGENGTFATGIDGSNIVGYYRDSFGKRHGFLYDGSIFTTLSYPSAFETSPSGIDGTNVVGWYLDSATVFHGFLYNGTTYTTLDVGFRTFPYGIDGNNIVGGYYVSLNGGNHGFLYDGTTYTILDDPSAKPEGTYAAIGIDGSNMVGTYYDTSGNLHGFLATVPEPPTLLMTLTGLLAFWRRRRPRRS
jgi:hypothetical protein